MRAVLKVTNKSHETTREVKVDVTVGVLRYTGSVHHVIAEKQETIALEPGQGIRTIKRNAVRQQYVP